MSDIKAHLFPFSVDKEGSINANQFLKVEKKEDCLETVVLGRKLLGHSVTVPDTVEGQVWEKNEDVYEEEGQDQPWIKTNQTIEEFILWRKDRAPDLEDARIKAIKDWVQIAEAINEPIPLN